MNKLSAEITLDEALNTFPLQVLFFTLSLTATYSMNSRNALIVGITAPLR